MQVCEIVPVVLRFLRMKKCWHGKIVHPKKKKEPHVLLGSELIISTGQLYKACTEKVKRSSGQVARPARHMGAPADAVSAYQKYLLKMLNHMIRGCQVHTSGRLCQRRGKGERGTLAWKEERGSPGSHRSCTGSSCEVLFSIRCIILKTHLTFQGGIGPEIPT